jgi:hypothetical protein
MSESIKLIYKILKILERSMDYPGFDINRLDSEVLCVSVFRGSEISSSENFITPIRE